MQKLTITKLIHC